MSSSGFVSIVGAGPGDPELLTIKAAKRLGCADVIVHDRLIGEGILNYCREDAELIDAGKTPGGHRIQQEDINRLLVDKAREGKFVVRLKGGDPFVFGRGAEEALFLASAGVPFEVIPGVSSSLAGPAAALIPVTHRCVARSVTIATGHDRDNSCDKVFDWEALAKASDTLVFLMAVENLERIVSNLISHGRNPKQLSALVRWATTPEQQVIFAPLQEIVHIARSRHITPPAVLVVGDTVEIGMELSRAIAYGETLEEVMHVHVA